MTNEEILQALKEIKAQLNIIANYITVQQTPKTQLVPVAKPEVTEQDIEQVYLDLYPLKKGKSKGIKTALKEIKSKQDLKDLKTSINNYNDSINDPKFIKHFSTFMNEWRDWLDPQAGKSSIQLTNWDTEAEYYFQAAREFGSTNPDKAREWLGDDRYNLILKLGGLRYVGGLRYDSFSVKKLAELLKQTHSNQG